MRRKSIDDIEYASDAAAIGYLKAAHDNIINAAKEFKKWHFAMRGTDLARGLDCLRSLSDTVFTKYVDFYNDMVRKDREEKMRKDMGLSRRKRNGRASA